MTAMLMTSQGRLRSAVAAGAMALATFGAPAAFAEIADSPRAAQDAMILAARQDPGTLDYVQSNLTALRLWIPSNVVEPLVVFNADGSVEPGVAESWEISDDGTTYVFHIREAHFSTGEPVTAADVVFSLNEMKNSPVVDNAAAFTAVDTIEVVDDRTVQVTLTRPSQGFWRGMGGLSGLVQSEAAADERALNPIGSGPYMLVEYVSNSHMRFGPNPHYWGDAPEVEDVTVRIITDGTAGLNAMEAGDIDAVPINTIDLWEQIVARGLDDLTTLETFPQAGEPTFAVLNQKLDPGLRQAIARTLDRQSFNDAFGAAWGAENTCTFALPHQSWYAVESAETCPYPYDFDEATRLVQENGYGDIDLEYASLSDVPDLSLPADLMIPLMEAAGFSVTRNAMDLARYSQLVFQGRPPQFDVTIMAGDANPNQWVCTDEDKAGWSTYCSPAYAEAMARADQATTDEGYDAAMLEAAAILREDAVIVPLLAKLAVGLYHHDLQGFAHPRVGVSIEFANFHWQ